MQIFTHNTIPVHIARVDPQLVIYKLNLLQIISLV
jgi:hypothetical protein